MSVAISAPARPSMSCSCGGPVAEDRLQLGRSVWDDDHAGHEQQDDDACVDEADGDRSRHPPPEPMHDRIDAVRDQSRDDEDLDRSGDKR
jgi:hypothetical protein